MTNIIPLQLELSQPIPLVVGNVDYRNFKNTLERIDELLILSGIEIRIMKYELDEAEKEFIKQYQEKDKVFKDFSYKQQSQIQLQVKRKIRYAISRKLTEESYRDFCVHLSESHLLQRFCLLDTLGIIEVPSKSCLERFEKQIPEEIIRECVAILVDAAKSPVDIEKNKQKIMLAKEIDMADYYLDATCVKANIHYPVDWVLLRDATKTLMKAIILIRKYGLLYRMDNPKEFIREINNLSIQMTHAHNKKDSKKKRKRILRTMKKLLKKIQAHGKRYRNLLETNWQETQLSYAQAMRIVERMDNVLNQLPEAIKQAHERIIGERQVKNEDKILSLYDPNVHVVVRGKPDAKVEFGNVLVIGEIKEGLIIDWKLYEDTVPGDSKFLPESLERLENNYQGYQPVNVATDRGCDSAANKKYLKSKGINNHMCPRSPKELQERCLEKDFLYHQKRRGQIEARIGIFKNNFLGKPLKSKGFKNKNQSIGWAILTHNLWVLARLSKIKVEEIQDKKTA
jgi:hypothetical protein